MTAKTSAKSMPSRAAMPAVKADERHQADVDTFVVRNREALNTSIRRSRDEVENGVRSTRGVADIIADGRKRHGG